MAKLIPLPTRAFGAEPGIPDIAALAGWIAQHRGKAADLLAYQLEESLVPQLEAGITAPCAGGLFYRSRIVNDLAGLNSDRTAVVGELGIEGQTLNTDAVMLSAIKKAVWCALPAPSALGLTDAVYGDEDEWGVALTSVYRRLMRNMRDAGTEGHVLIADSPGLWETSALARKNVFFFVPHASEKDLEILLECQRGIAVDPSRINVCITLAETYNISRIIIVDPDKDALSSAISAFDPDRIAAGGYCCADNCENYWRELVNSSVYPK